MGLVEFLALAALLALGCKRAELRGGELPRNPKPTALQTVLLAARALVEDRILDALGVLLAREEPDE
eukprot:5760365-Lingulodinium_polyedra.AAC.1